MAFMTHKHPGANTSLGKLQFAVLLELAVYEATEDNPIPLDEMDSRGTTLNRMNSLANKLLVLENSEGWYLTMWGEYVINELWEVGTGHAKVSAYEYAISL